MDIAYYWSGLLELARKIRSFDQPIDYCFLKFGDTAEIHINRLPIPDPTAHLLLIILNPETMDDHPLATVIELNGASASLRKSLDLPDGISSFLCVYLPYCFLSIRARQIQRAVAITHFAQTLDGKIATLSGDSKWIGNEENLIHAHRMRALCDSILIGSKTMHYDQPSLTVRLVEGNNPRRIVICSSEGDFSSLNATAEDAPLVLGVGKDPCIRHINYQQFTPTQEGTIACHDILSYLFRQGLYTVYIEGGAATTSQFMKEKMIDIVQLHISPVIFGSGVSSFLLPEIEHVQAAICFEKHFFTPMGNTYMFVGEMNLQD